MSDETVLTISLTKKQVELLEGVICGWEEDHSGAPADEAYSDDEYEFIEGLKKQCVDIRINDIFGDKTIDKGIDENPPEDSEEDSEDPKGLGQWFKTAKGDNSMTKDP